MSLVKFGGELESEWVTCPVASDVPVCLNLGVLEDLVPSGPLFIKWFRAFPAPAISRDNDCTSMDSSWPVYTARHSWSQCSTEAASSLQHRATWLLQTPSSSRLQFPSWMISACSRMPCMFSCTCWRCVSISRTWCVLGGEGERGPPPGPCSPGSKLPPEKIAVTVVQQTQMGPLLLPSVSGVTTTMATWMCCIGKVMWKNNLGEPPWDDQQLM